MSQPPAEPSHPPRRRRRWWLVAASVVLLAAVAVLGARSGDGGDADTPGGPNHPLDLTEGQAFEVDGFDYAGGWTLGADPGTGVVQLAGLRLTNHRDHAERLAATVRLVDGNVVAAALFCKAGDGYDFVPVGTTIAVLCESSDPMPDDYDAVTIQDAY
jgi:hypothetical protein